MFATSERRPRVLYYALGGGLGHLVRGCRFLQQFGLAEDALLLSTSPRLHDKRITGGIATRAVPLELQHDRERFRGWLADCIAEYRPQRVCVDCFPGGILGELCDFAPLADLELWHLARLLNWPRYAAQMHGSAPIYARTFRLEPLGAAQQHFLQTHSASIEDLTLNTRADGIARSLLPDGPFWLVLHSGPASEVAELLAHADEARRIEMLPRPLIVATHAPPDQLPAACSVLDLTPASPLIDAAERIYSAAGFNVMLETARHRHKHHIIPLPRPFDDQFERARRARGELGIP